VRHGTGYLTKRLEAINIVKMFGNLQIVHASPDDNRGSNNKYHDKRRRSSTHRECLSLPIGKEQFFVQADSDDQRPGLDRPVRIETVNPVHLTDIGECA